MTIPNCRSLSFRFVRPQTVGLQHLPTHRVLSERSYQGIFWGGFCPFRGSKTKKPIQSRADLSGRYRFQNVRF
jgi:hypothetical protein